MTGTEMPAQRDGTANPVPSYIMPEGQSLAKGNFFFHGGEPGAATTTDDTAVEATAIAAGTEENVNAPKKKRRRRRAKGKPPVPVGRSEAVELLRQAVARFRGAQISWSTASGGVGGTEGAAAAGEKDPGTVAAEEFAEIARRCLGSGFPEIALEVCGCEVLCVLTMRLLSRLLFCSSVRLSSLID